MPLKMLTDLEFKKRWSKMSSYQRKFCKAYLENGLNGRAAAIEAGYNSYFVKSPHKVMRKINDVLDYLIQRNQIVTSLVKPAWVYNEYMKLYESTTSELTKQNILKDLSKLLQMMNEAPQVNIENNVPATPVQIVFTKEEK